MAGMYVYLWRIYGRHLGRGSQSQEPGREHTADEKSTVNLSRPGWNLKPRKFDSGNEILCEMWNIRLVWYSALSVLIIPLSAPASLLPFCLTSTPCLPSPPSALAVSPPPSPPSPSVLLGSNSASIWLASTQKSKRAESEIGVDKRSKTRHRPVKPRFLLSLFDDWSGETRRVS